MRAGYWTAFGIEYVFFGIDIATFYKALKAQNP
jgi:hypothetical protein